MFSPYTHSLKLHKLKIYTQIPSWYFAQLVHAFWGEHIFPDASLHAMLPFESTFISLKMDQLLNMMLYLNLQEKRAVVCANKCLVHINKYPFLHLDSQQYVPDWWSVHAYSRFLLRRNLFMGTKRIHASWSEQPPISMCFREES